MNKKFDKAVVTLSFDDGRKDTYDVFLNILKPMNIPATVNIPTGYIECNYSNPLEIGYNGLMTKAQLDEISQLTIFEIAGHGYMHKNDDDDVKKGIERLRHWYPTNRIAGFASPHSDLSDEEALIKHDFYKTLGIEYVRVGRRFSRSNIWRRILSKIASVSGNTSAFVMCYKSSLNDSTDFVIHAIPIIRTTRFNQIKKIIDYSVISNKYCVLEIHGIDSSDSQEYQELFCWDKESFIMLCDYLMQLQSEGKIEIRTTIDVVDRG